jgi:hypothetical protein
MLWRHLFAVKAQHISYGDLSGVTDARLRRRGVLAVEIALKRCFCLCTISKAAFCALLELSVDNEPHRSMGNTTSPFVVTGGTEPEMGTGGVTRHNSLIRSIAASVV